MQAKQCSRTVSAVSLLQAVSYTLISASTVTCTPPQSGTHTRALPAAPAATSTARFELQRTDSVMQKSLEAALDASGLAPHVRRGRLAVAVVELAPEDKTYYAAVNDDEMMYAASLPKIAILLAVARAASENKIAWTAALRRRLKSMVTVSSNGDAAWAAQLVGLPYIAETVRRYGLYDEKHGGLWMGRAYRRGARAQRDPLKHLSHAASARQAARFYALLHARKLISPKWSAEMLALMGPPGHHHKFVAAIGNRPGVVFTARKSGSWRTFHSDSALVRHNGHSYVVAALSDLPNGEHVMRQVARIIDDLVMAGAHRARPSVSAQPSYVAAGW
jgi:beta-lactamase class A